MAPKQRTANKRQRGESSRAREEPQVPAFERFSSPGAFDRYRRFMSVRPIRQERGLEIQVPADWNWGPRFLAQPGDAYASIVREFYANAKDGLQQNRCMVRGIEVDYSPAAINEYYETIDHMGEDYFNRTLSAGRLHINDLNDIARTFDQVATWNIRNNQAAHMDYKYFQPSDRALLDFIKARLIPHSHKGNVRKDQVLLAYCIKHHYTIDVGDIINKFIRDTATSEVKSRVFLGHPYLITQLCQLAGVPINESQDVRVLPQAFLSQQYITTRYRTGQPADDGDDEDEDDVDRGAANAPQPAAPQPAAPEPAPTPTYEMQDLMRRLEEELRLQQDYRRMHHEVSWYVGTSQYQHNQAYLGSSAQFPPPPPWLQDPQFIPEFYRGQYPPPPPPPDEDLQ